MKIIIALVFAFIVFDFCFSLRHSLTKHHARHRKKQDVSSSYSSSSSSFSSSSTSSSSKMSSQRFSKVSSSSSSKSQMPTWPAEMEESVESSSDQECSDINICRSWEEIKDVSYCKAAKLAQLLKGGSTKEIFYVKTSKKATGRNEWSKFLYAEVDMQKPQTGKVTGGARFIRICVPTSVQEYAWLDDICALDDCGPKPQAMTQCQNNLSPEYEKMQNSPIDQNIQQAQSSGELKLPENAQTEQNQNNVGIQGQENQNNNEQNNSNGGENNQ